MLFKTYLAGQNAVELKTKSQKNRWQEIRKTASTELPEDTQEGKQSRGVLLSCFSVEVCDLNFPKLPKLFSPQEIFH